MAYIAFSGMKVKGHGEGQTIWCEQKGLITRSVHVKYESATSNGWKVIAYIKF